jgi:hypothetical protein
MYLKYNNFQGECSHGVYKALLCMDTQILTYRQTHMMKIYYNAYNTYLYFTHAIFFYSITISWENVVTEYMKRDYVWIYIFLNTDKYI